MARANRGNNHVISGKMEVFVRSFLGLLFLVCASFYPCMSVSSHCVELGYSSNLMCSSCRELKEFNLQILEGECQQCCQEDGTMTDDKAIHL